METLAAGDQDEGAAEPEQRAAVCHQRSRSPGSRAENLTISSGHR
ncbi:hypothetical protein [Streptomyces sp. NPDC003006]